MTMKKKQPDLGFPINAISRCTDVDHPEQHHGIFPNAYFLNCMGGLKRWGNRINFVEQHFQDPREVRDALYVPERRRRLEDSLAEARHLGLDVVAHLPFLKAQEADVERQMPFAFNFYWPVIPSEYVDRTFKKLPSGVEIIVEQETEEDAKLALDAAARFGIRYVTKHLAAPMSPLNDLDFKKNIQFVINQTEYIARRGYDLHLSIETGGPNPEQMYDMINTVKSSTGQAPLITFDTAHILLDLMYADFKKRIAAGETETVARRKIESKLYDYNAQVIDLFKSIYEYIRVIHLTQTLNWGDLHLGIERPEGILRCNEQIVREVQQREDNKFIMIEAAPSEDALTLYERAANGQATSVFMKNEHAEDFLVICMGGPSSGKSTGLDSLRADVFDNKPSVLRTDTIRELYEQSWALDRFVAQGERQLVYDEMLRISRTYLTGKNGLFVEGSFQTRANRHMLENMASELATHHVYPISFQTDGEEAKRRIVAKDHELSRREKAGERPANRLSMRSPKVYNDFMNEWEPIDYKREFTATNHHLLIVDTTNCKIRLCNPNQRAWDMARALQRFYADTPEINKNYTIEQVSRENLS